jgi:hypothetical protein
MFIVCPIRRAQAPEESRDGGMLSWHEKKRVATTRLKALSPAFYKHAAATAVLARLAQR